MFSLKCSEEGAVVGLGVTFPQGRKEREGIEGVSWKFHGQSARPFPWAPEPSSVRSVPGPEHGGCVDAALSPRLLPPGALQM